MTRARSLPPTFTHVGRAASDILGRLTEASQGIDDASTEAAIEAAENNELVKTAAGRFAALTAREAELASKRKP